MVRSTGLSVLVPGSRLEAPDSYPVNSRLRREVTALVCFRSKERSLAPLSGSSVAKKIGHLSQIGAAIAVEVSGEQFEHVISGALFHICERRARRAITLWASRFIVEYEVEIDTNHRLMKMAFHILFYLRYADFILSFGRRLVFIGQCAV